MSKDYNNTASTIAAIAVGVISFIPCWVAARAIAAFGAYRLPPIEEMWGPQWFVNVAIFVVIGFPSGTLAGYLCSSASLMAAKDADRHITLVSLSVLAILFAILSGVFLIRLNGLTFETALEIATACAPILGIAAKGER